MTRFRISTIAQLDLSQILVTSAEHWGIEGRRRYAAIIAAAMRKVTAEPEIATSRSRGELGRNLRSFHLRNARAGDPGAKVRRPVHVLYYRAVRPGLVEIVRVLHERMDARRHLGHADPDL